MSVSKYKRYRVQQLTSSRRAACMRRWSRTRPSRDDWPPIWPWSCWTVFPDFGTSWTTTTCASGDPGTTAGPWRWCIRTTSFGCPRLCGFDEFVLLLLLLHSIRELCVKFVFLGSAEKSEESPIIAYHRWSILCGRTAAFPKICDGVCFRRAWPRSGVCWHVSPFSSSRNDPFKWTRSTCYVNTCKKTESTNALHIYIYKKLSKKKNWIIINVL